MDAKPRPRLDQCGWQCHQPAEHSHNLAAQQERRGGLALGPGDRHHAAREVAEGELEYRRGNFDKAFALAPTNSMYALWLGRAYGRRAETSIALTTYLHYQGNGAVIRVPGFKR